MWLGTVIALVLAAVLIAYLHRQYTTEQQALTLQLYQQVCERTAALLVDRLQYRFGAVVRETLERIDHRAVERYEPAAVAPQLAAGLVEHPFVERFFIWSDKGPAAWRDQMLFFRPVARGSADEIPITGGDGEPSGAFFVDPEQGLALMNTAVDPRYRRVTFIAEQTLFRGVPYQVVIHQFGTPPPLRSVRGIIGYTVNLTTVRQRILREVIASELKATIPQTFPHLQFNVVDEHGEVVYGSRPRTGVPTATAVLDMSFFADDIATVFVDNRLHGPLWHLLVSTGANEPPAARRQYLFAAVFLLIVIALTCAVSVYRQSLRLSEMHSEFVSNVSHQLRTPLSILMATAETLRLHRVRTPDKIDEYARRLENQAARLARLVEQILRFSRIKAGLDLYRFERLDLAGLVEGALARFDAPDSEHGFSLTFEGPGEEVPVEADPAALEEMLVNLLENALKYGDGRTRVLVSVHRRGGDAIVSVRDDGRGIAAADLPHIFDRFYRGGSQGRQSQGFGLGLAIVSDIVRAHRGRVTVDSAPGTGTDFRVSLPISGGAIYATSRRG